MPNIVIAGYARSPFTLAKKGGLTKVRPDDLVADVVRALVQRTGIDPNEIEDLLLGCAFPEGEQGLNMARLVALQADLPLSVGGATVNRFCGSSMHAIHIAAGQIGLGAGEAFICAGVESMTRIPMGGYNPMPNPALNAKQPGAYVGMGDTAENVSRRWQITRAAQEELAVRSHAKAAAAQAEGRFADEIVPIKTTVTPSTRTAASARNLEGGSRRAEAVVRQGGRGDSRHVLAALTDGAPPVLVCSEEFARRNNLEPLARLAAVAVSGCDPEIMGIGPVAATRKALKRANIDMSKIDVVELNEAFAAQALACMKELGIRDETLNLDGGAIALGHPLGATGARITGKAASLLKREGGRYALATQCIGGGQGIATIMERL